MRLLGTAFALSCGADWRDHTHRHLARRQNLHQYMMTDRPLPETEIEIIHDLEQNILGHIQPVLLGAPRPRFQIQI